MLPKNVLRLNLYLSQREKFSSEEMKQECQEFFVCFVYSILGRSLEALVSRDQPPSETRGGGAHPGGLARVLGGLLCPCPCSTRRCLLGSEPHRSKSFVFELSTSVLSVASAAE